MIEQPPPVEGSLNVFNKLNDSGIKSLLKSINDDYLYWDKVKYKKTKGTSAQELWSIVKLSRSINYAGVNFGKYSFVYNLTDYIQKVLHDFDMNIGGYMGAHGIVPEEDKTKYLVSSIMEEAISSSQIEGANTTRKKAKEMLRKEVKPKTKGEQMIVNNYITIKHITQNKNADLTPETLLYIHQLIAKDTLDHKDEEGDFRKSNDIYVVNNLTSEVAHTPPNFNEIPKLIRDLCLFFNKDDENRFIHPIVKAIIIHFMVGYIHPFADGNGRTARALFYWYMLKKGYWLTEYLSISRIIADSKTQYEKAYLYTENDDNDLSYFITYHLGIMEKSFAALKNYIQLKQREFAQIASFIRIPNVNGRQAQILKILVDKPETVFNIKEIENRFSVSSYTARTDLKGLVELGFLDIIQVNKIKQNFVRAAGFDELLNKKK